MDDGHGHARRVVPTRFYVLSKPIVPAVGPFGKEPELPHARHAAVVGIPRGLARR
jgi:hypothetical protein